MIKTCRILLPHDESRTMEDVAAELLATVGLTLADVSLKVPSTDSYSTETHFGNWVIVPARYLPELDALGNRVDHHSGIIEESDIDAVQIGQKVNVVYESWLAQMIPVEGKVLRKGTINGFKTVDVLKKGSRTKGWQLRAGDFGSIAAKA